MEQKILMCFMQNPERLKFIKIHFYRQKNTFHIHTSNTIRNVNEQIVSTSIKFIILIHFIFQTLNLNKYVYTSKFKLMVSVLLFCNLILNNTTHSK